MIVDWKFFQSTTIDRRKTRAVSHFFFLFFQKERKPFFIFEKGLFKKAFLKRLFWKSLFNLKGFLKSLFKKTHYVTLLISLPKIFDKLSVRTDNDLNLCDFFARERSEASEKIAALFFEIISTKIWSALVKSVRFSNTRAQSGKPDSKNDKWCTKMPQKFAKFAKNFCKILQNLQKLEGAPSFKNLQKFCKICKNLQKLEGAPSPKNWPVLAQKLVSPQKLISFGPKLASFGSDQSQGPKNLASFVPKTGQFLVQNWPVWSLTSPRAPKNWSVLAQKLVSFGPKLTSFGPWPA